MSTSIVVNIYSNPKYTALEIFDKHGYRVTSGTNVKIIFEYRSVLASFHGSIVNVKGYRVTLKLERLTQEYFTEYTFRAINDFGHSDHKTSVLIASKVLNMRQLKI